MAKENRLRKKNGFSFGMALIYFGVAVLALICLYPFVNVIAYSLSGYNAVLSAKVTFYPIDFTIDAYKEIIRRPQLWLAMKTTVLVTLYGTALSLALTTIAAYALSRKELPGKGFLTGIILFTMYFGGGMIPPFLVVMNVGLYDTLPALFVPQAVNVFNFIVMRTFFKDIPDSLEEAARIDGASYIQCLVRIFLPLSVPIIATMALFYAVGYWNTYFDALIYIQDPNKYTLQLRLRGLLTGDELNNSANLEGVGTQVMAQSLKMATVAVSTIPILVVYPWLQKYFVKGVMIGSIKG